jgi:cytochrome oxidase assembly protein ShyY1
VGHALVVAVVVSFTQFGFWQLRRHEQRMERNDVTRARLAAEPIPLRDALAEIERLVAEGVPAALAIRDLRVQVSGVFEPDDEVLRRPVARDGRPGYHVVTPLRLGDAAEAERLWVERGWVSDVFDRVPLADAPPPAGRVEVVGRLQALTPTPSGFLAAFAPRDPPTGRLVTVAYLDPQRLAGQVRGPLLPLALALESSTPAQPAAWPLAILTPELTLGSHLGYALQWFSFVLITIIGYAALTRRVVREAAGR